MNLLTKHYRVYGNNTYLNAEKKTKKAQNTRRGLCARLLNSCSGKLKERMDFACPNYPLSISNVYI